MAEEGNYVNIIEDNDPAGRYDGKKGTVTRILKEIDPEDVNKEIILYVVEVDINSGEQGTCLAKTVEVTDQRPI